MLGAWIEPISELIHEFDARAWEQALKTYRNELDQVRVSVAAKGMPEER
jgi:hypothetical protein